MTARRDARRTTSPLAPPTGDLIEMPADLRFRPPTPHTVREYTDWRRRQREWLEEHDLIDDRGNAMWSRINRGTPPAAHRGTHANTTIIGGRS